MIVREQEGTQAVCKIFRALKYYNAVLLKVKRGLLFRVFIRGLLS
jgi:hypothetical protein